MLPKPDISKPVFQHPDFHIEAMYTQLGICPNCYTPICEEDFVDEISRREYSVSGLCQMCQDVMFAEPEEDYDEIEPPF